MQGLLVLGGVVAVKGRPQMRTTRIPFVAPAHWQRRLWQQDRQAAGGCMTTIHSFVIDRLSATCQGNCLGHMLQTQLVFCLHLDCRLLMFSQRNAVFTVI